MWVYAWGPSSDESLWHPLTVRRFGAKVRSSAGRDSRCAAAAKAVYSRCVRARATDVDNWRAEYKALVDKADNEKVRKGGAPRGDTLERG